jgi:hypothetical protein
MEKSGEQHSIGITMPRLSTSRRASGQRFGSASSSMPL